MDCNNTDTIIIGGGMGGLFTGALLAKVGGRRVTVLEKNATAGGGLQMFRRYGGAWETGMHILGGFGPGGSVKRICQLLGVYDKLRLRQDDIDCANTIYCAAEGKTYRVAQGREGFIRSWTAYFPQEEEGLRAYVDKLYELTDEVDLFHLRPSKSAFVTTHSEMFDWSADRLIAHYIRDPHLRDLLAFMAPMYGGVGGHTPAYVHAIVNVLYIDWQGRFVDGSQQLADALASVIRASGGQVLTSSEVTRIKVENKHIQWVETADGQQHQAQSYVCSLHPCTMLRLIDGKAFNAGFERRMEEIPNSFSAFIVYLTLRPGTVPYFDHPAYYMLDYGQLWHYDQPVGHDWPQGLMCYTAATSGQDEWARQMVVNAIMPFESVHQWADTRVGHRGPDYEEWKRQCMARVMERLEEMFPGIAQGVEHSFAASPLTIRDYYGVKDGALYGFMPDCQNSTLSHMVVYTKVDNLYLTGQNINLHGICGVPLTAITTAEALLGQNVVLDAIGKLNQNVTICNV